MKPQFPPDAVRFSHLKRMALSPAHFRSAVLEEATSTPAMTHGTLVHALILGGTQVAVYEGKVRRGKEWDAFEAKHEGKTIVLRSHYERAMECARCVMTHPIAGPLLRNADRELRLSWQVLGRACRGTIDVRGDDFICDVKTSALASPEWFARQAIRLGYHAQLSWYREGARQNRYRVDRCFIIAVEPKPPFAVTVLQLTDRALEEGEKCTRLWMERFLACESAREWPEYVQSVVDLDVPEEDDDLPLTFGDEEGESDVDDEAA